MPISLTPFSHDDAFFGNTWEVSDEDELARQIAVIALGYSHHVQIILTGTGVATQSYPEEVAPSALALLTVEGNDPSHRDGWLFQAMSWIAAVRANPTAILAAPHMQHADKGFDGLQIEVDSVTNKVTTAVIFEDKATTNPRKTLTRPDKGVWKEFAELEEGLRLSFFTAQVVGALRTRTDINADDSIKEVLWKEARCYRVSITVGDTHSNQAGRKRLFKGYEEIVKGKLTRRRAETFHHTKLREWLDALAEKAKAEVISGATKNV